MPHGAGHRQRGGSLGRLPQSVSKATYSLKRAPSAHLLGGTLSQAVPGPAGAVALGTMLSGRELNTGPHPPAEKGAATGGGQTGCSDYSGEEMATP